MNLFILGAFGLFLAMHILNGWNKSGRNLFRTGILIQAIFIAAYIFIPAVVEYAAGNSELESGDYQNIIFASILIQLGFSVFYLFGYLLGPSAKPSKYIRSIPLTLEASPKFIRITILCVIAISGLYDVYAGMSSAYGMTQQQVLDEDVNVTSNLFGFFSRFFIPMLAVLIVSTYRLGSRKVLILLLAVLFIVLGVKLTIGTRAPVTHSLVLIATATWVLIGKRQGATILVGAIAVLLFMSPIILELRSGVLQTDASTSVKIQAITDLIDNGKIDENAIMSVVSRGDIIQNTRFLYEYLQGNGEYSLLQPYYGVFVSWIPRLIYDSKPYARSIDGTVRGIPEYKLAELMYNSNYLSITTHGGINSYWQFGWIGVTMVALLSGALLGWVITSLAHTGLWGLGLALYIFENSMFSGGASLDAVLQLIIQVIVPLIIASQFLIIINRIRRSKN